MRPAPLLLALLLLALLLAGCAGAASCAALRRDPQRLCPDLQGASCDPRTALERACCCGSGLPPCGGP